MEPQFLSLAVLDQLMQRALDGIQCEFPNTLERVLKNPKPREIHPAFYGCYDWHSAVHTHWTLVKLLKSFPNLPNATALREAISTNLTAANLLAEAANFGEIHQPITDDWIVAVTTPGQPGFERPYGWAWLLQLAAELRNWGDEEGQKWEENLQPLTQKIVALFERMLKEQLQPDREGQHGNTAFALALTLDYARVCGQTVLENKITEYVQHFYLADKDYPAESEPDKFDFLSPSLGEADLVQRVISPVEFSKWFNRFLPEIASRSILQPVIVSDHKDPYLSHQDGLNLSRAWCLHNIANALPETDSVKNILLEAAERHTQEGLGNIFAGDFSSTGHWLATFAVYLLK